MYICMCLYVMNIVKQKKNKKAEKERADWTPSGRESCAWCPPQTSHCRSKPLPLSHFYWA